MSPSGPLTIEIPSKTFVIGEYLAIQGTASMVLASHPCFEVKATACGKKPQAEPRAFHPESPAASLQKRLKQEGVSFDLFDPHGPKGGFGRSTAEYLSVYLYHHSMKFPQTPIHQNLLDHLESFVREYQENAGQKTSPPSGADLVAQLCGGLCWYDGMNFKAESLPWPFPGYDLLVFHTGKKLSTHMHLKEIEKTNREEWRSLIPFLLAARTAFDRANLKVFCESLNAYYDQLGLLGLSDQDIQKKVLKLREAPEVLAAKGCGAMGMDTLLVVGESSEASHLKSLVLNQGFEYITCLSQSHGGAKIRRFH